VPHYNGDNLHTNSVVALSGKTGELKWHYQFTPHDLHDWDSTEPLLLVDEPRLGKPRKLLLHADRNGFFFALDRTNGELLLAKPFVKVNWTTGYGKNGRPVLSNNFETSGEGVLTCPASSGGTNWFSSSWSPITRLFYVRATEWCAIYKKQQDPLVENRWYGGVAPNQPGSSLERPKEPLWPCVGQRDLASRFGSGLASVANDLYDGRKAICRAPRPHRRILICPWKLTCQEDSAAGFSRSLFLDNPTGSDSCVIKARNAYSPSSSTPCKRKLSISRKLQL
jgi:hypothetical protein